MQYNFTSANLDTGTFTRYKKVTIKELNEILDDTTAQINNVLKLATNDNDNDKNIEEFYKLHTENLNRSDTAKLAASASASTDPPAQPSQQASSSLEQTVKGRLQNIQDYIQVFTREIDQTKDDLNNDWNNIRTKYEIITDFYKFLKYSEDFFNNVYKQQYNNNLSKLQNYSTVFDHGTNEQMNNTTSKTTHIKNMLLYFFVNNYPTFHDFNIKQTNTLSEKYPLNHISLPLNFFNQLNSLLYEFNNKNNTTAKGNVFFITSLINEIIDMEKQVEDGYKDAKQKLDENNNSVFSFRQPAPAE